MQSSAHHRRKFWRRSFHNKSDVVRGNGEGIWGQQDFNKVELVLALDERPSKFIGALMNAFLWGAPASLGKDYTCVRLIPPLEAWPPAWEDTRGWTKKCRQLPQAQDGGCPPEEEHGYNRQVKLSSSKCRIHTFWLWKRKWHIMSLFALVRSSHCRTPCWASCWGTCPLSMPGPRRC